MTSIIRQEATSGRVLGIAATNQSKAVNIRARQSVIVATGGHSSNVNVRRIFDPRLTDEYQVAREPYTFLYASCEIAAMAIGASLWGAYNQDGRQGGLINPPSTLQDLRLRLCATAKAAERLHNPWCERCRSA
jgi:hypothetical protein